MKTEKPLNKTEFDRIYTDAKFRNAVAFAHVCCTADGKPYCKKALDYPQSWVVSEEQIKEAKAERRRAVDKTKAENKGNLVFVGMGVETDKGDGIINHRFRSTFRNDKGERCFVEYSYCDTKHAPDCLCCTFWIADYKGKKETYHPTFYAPKSLSFVLDQVNQGFGCSFDGVVIDNYNLHPDETEEI